MQNFLSWCGVQVSSKKEHFLSTFDFFLGPDRHYGRT